MTDMVERVEVNMATYVLLLSLLLCGSDHLLSPGDVLAVGQAANLSSGYFFLVDVYSLWKERR